MIIITIYDTIVIDFQFLSHEILWTVFLVAFNGKATSDTIFYSCLISTLVWLLHSRVNKQNTHNAKKTNEGATEYKHNYDTTNSKKKNKIGKQGQNNSQKQQICLTTTTTINKQQQQQQGQTHQQRQRPATKRKNCNKSDTKQ